MSYWGSTRMSSLAEEYDTISRTLFRVQELYFTADICVWWNMMSCPWPKENDLTSIRRNIELALKNMNYHGAVTIFAYSNVNTIPPDMFDVLCSQKIEFREVKEGEDLRRMMTVDILIWKLDHRKPANYLVITDEDILMKVDFHNANVLIAAKKPRLRGIFLRRAASVWEWSSLATGGRPLLAEQIQ